MLRFTLWDSAILHRMSGRPVVTMLEHKIYLPVVLCNLIYTSNHVTVLDNEPILKDELSLTRPHTYTIYPPGNARHHSTYLPQHGHLWSSASLRDTGNAGTHPGRMARWPPGRGLFRVVGKHL